MFFWNSLAFSMIEQMLAIWSLVPLPFLKPDAWTSGSSTRYLNIWKFTIHILLKPGLENFERYFTSMWDECNFAVVAMAPHSSVLAWRIPGTGEPGGLLSMGSHRVRHDWSDLAYHRAFFGSAFLLDWNENWPFPDLWLLLSFPNLPAYFVQPFHSIIF